MKGFNIHLLINVSVIKKDTSEASNKERFSGPVLMTRKLLKHPQDGSSIEKGCFIYYLLMHERKRENISILQYFLSIKTFSFCTTKKKTFKISVDFLINLIHNEIVAVYSLERLFVQHQFSIVLCSECMRKKGFCADDGWKVVMWNIAAH